jgi:hypothetical protein
MILRVKADLAGSVNVAAMHYWYEYLPSSLWQKIRRRVLRRDKKICFYCGGTAILVHHRSYTRKVLEGRADHRLVSLCEGCHGLIHFSDKGNKRSLIATDRILMARTPPIEIPEPVVDLRRLNPIPQPREWPRMTAIQRQGWLVRYKEIWHAALAEKRAAASVRRRNTPRKALPAGRMSLAVAIALWTKEPGTPSNSYSWYRESARTTGKISLHRDRAEIKVEKIGGEWFVAESKLRAALALQRKREGSPEGKRKRSADLAAAYERYC